ncbi:MAG: ABC transporter ATP-binding protein [Lachnospiraceae bacterium]|nr:ABC transporter ATP-binding protein [Lachnospiraceae bacterium]
MNSKKISMKNVSYSITEGERNRKLLKNVTTDFEGGKITVISGPSGSGKTTLLYAMAGLLDRVEGEIHIGNTDINKLSAKEKAAIRLENISIIFQNLNLFSFMNVEDNILVPLYLKNRTVTEETRKKIAHYLDLMCLGQIQEKKISNLSGGEQQRVAIIRALIDDPEVVLCDEPTASLDSENTHQFMETLVKISRESGAAIIIVTHDARVFAYGEEKVTMVDGELFDDENNVI